MSKKLKNSKGGMWVPLLFIAALLFASYMFGTTLELKSTTDPNERYNIDQTSSFEQKGTVQMGSVKLNMLTPTPLPTAVPTAAADVCNHDMFKKADPLKCSCDNAWLIRCEGNLCKEVKPGKGTPNNYTCGEIDSFNWCQIFSKEGDGWYCIGKPVIYLYPEVPTFVDVKVATEGEIFISDPPIQYGSQTKKVGGWNDVLALPSGTLLHQGKTYRELFYESVTKDVKRPEKGVVIEKDNLENGLSEFIARLGLTRSDERQEFLDWWMPRLKNLEGDKLFVSVLEKDEKSRLDTVHISPKPDTFIEFIVYFAPLSGGETVEPLILPETPKRIGFTAIEWGGVIDPDPQF